ncbi:hypothetical protein [Falsiruegeria mediterranea]|uniref:Uncharacterized protein n=1 Tax=Falsiruegeria mediterranea M17 TaxID=1200281 RepID=A0A2R8C2X7_9RHOB|nr:hypothetical protein [Falsiruegeria mediterranea]SPJ26784.1 hypothetical protein TRM7615_00253 [Falsiruegeria mediterranea M17]
MNEKGKLEDHLRNSLSQSAYDLFVVFGRFEYAMKRGGFRRQNHAQAAWETFARDLPDQFFDRMRADAQTEAFIDRPPRTTGSDGGGGVDWLANLDIPQNCEDLFECVKTVRNNLVHGDKWRDCDRDERLIQAALFVLNEAYREIRKCSEFDQFLENLNLAFQRAEAPD